MEFHEDFIFKCYAQNFGSELIEILDIVGEIIEVLPSEYPDIEPKIYKPDIVFELKDKILILEFQSTNVNNEDKRRFRHYTSLLDLNVIKSEKPIEVHVLSTFEKEKTKTYEINQDSIFTIYVHALNKYSADEFLNKMSDKIKNKKQVTRKDLLMMSLVCFMENNDVEQTILNSAETITNIQYFKDINVDIIKGVILILSDKFITDEKLYEKIVRRVAKNMKSLDNYIDKRVKEGREEGRQEGRQEGIIETDKKWMMALVNEGFSLKDIAKMMDVSLDFVKQTLSD